MSDTERESSAYFDRIRLKHRKPETMSMNEGMFAQSVGLSHLAVDLARLAWQREKSNREPFDFLNDAAHLVNEAAKLTGTDSAEALEAYMQRFKAKRQAKQIPLSALHGADATGLEVFMDDGSRFNFTPFTTERGWKEFLEKHFRRVLPDWLKSELLEHLTKNMNTQSADDAKQARESATQAAVDYLTTTRWEGMEHLLKQAAMESASCKDVEWPEAVLMRWTELEANCCADFWSKDWEADGLNYATLQSLAETKRLGNKAKGSGKRQKAKPTEETGRTEATKVKKQGVARKKQGRG